jgi:hypothetical protein
MSAGELARRGVAYVVGLGATAAVLSPLVSGAADSFPISTYPMFARAPGQPTLFAVVATAPDGTAESVPPELVGSAEVLQVKVLIQRSVQRGPLAMAELCEATAARVAAADRGGRLGFVDIVRRRYDPVAYFVTSVKPLDEERIFRCAIPATTPPRMSGGQRP